MVDQIAADHRAAELSPRWRAICDYSAKLTTDPAAMSEDDVNQLKSHGLDDADVLDVVQVAAYFNYINRVADALGVDHEDFMSARAR